jgi:hypothetical protein
MACAGCQQRREMLARAAQAARQGNISAAGHNIAQMTRSIIGRGPNANLSTKPPAPGPYKLRLTQAAQEVYHLKPNGSKNKD